MSRSYWLPLVALIGFLSVGASPHKHHASPTQQATEAQSEKPAPQPAIARSQENIGSAKYEPPCHNPHNQSESELCASWENANAAREAATWTKAGAFVGAFGVIGLVFSLYFSARATQAALKTVERISQIEAGRLASNFDDFVEKDGKKQVSVYAINTGNTRVTIHYSDVYCACIGCPEQSFVVPTEFTLGPRKTQKYALLKGEKFFIGRCDCSNAHSTILGGVIYSDVFGEFASLGIAHAIDGFGTVQTPSAKFDLWDDKEKLVRRERVKGAIRKAIYKVLDAKAKSRLVASEANAWSHIHTLEKQNGG